MNLKYIYILAALCTSIFASDHHESLKQKKEIGLITIKVGKFLFWEDAKLYAITPKPYCKLTMNSRKDSLESEKDLPKNFANNIDKAAIRALRHFNLMNGFDYPIGSKFYWKIYDDFSIDLDRKSMPTLKSNL